MVMDTGAGFDADAKAREDAINPRVLAWETLTNTFQQPLPWALAGQKWLPMSRIFALADCA
jgi:L-rhamnose mutarotase